MAELRHDPIRDHWVLIAEDRARRPNEWTAREGAGPGEPCPFCPGNEGMTPPASHVAPGPHGWRVRVVPNKYPALVPAGPEAPPEESILVPGTLPARGGHEVVVETPHHERDFDAFDDEEAALVLGVYRERFLRWSAEPGVLAVVPFKNFGPRAGATLSHPHGQIAALPIVPPATAREQERAEALGIRRGACIWCAALEEAEGAGRSVARNSGAIAVVPFAARVPFETWILPLRHESRFGDAAPESVRAAAGLLRSLIARLKRVVPGAAYNWVLHAGAPGGRPDPQQHWRIEVIPRTSQLAGFELGTGMYLSVVSPEHAAQRLADADDRRPPGTAAGGAR